MQLVNTIILACMVAFLFLIHAELHSIANHGIEIRYGNEMETNYWGVKVVKPLEVRVWACTNYPPYKP